MTATPANDFGGVPKWIPVAQELPPEGEIVLTKIDLGTTMLNVQHLKHLAGLWFFAGGDICAHYTPTHWARD